MRVGQGKCNVKACKVYQILCNVVQPDLLQTDVGMIVMNRSVGDLLNELKIYNTFNHKEKWKGTARLFKTCHF